MTQNILVGSRIPLKVLKDFRMFQNVLEDSKKVYNVPKDSAREKFKI